MPKGRLYAIGDIHGCIDELNVLLNWFEEDQAITRDDRVIFIGDYIDRGVDSCACIDALIQFKVRHSETFFLRGNHEDMLLDYIGLSGSNGDFYLSNGGDTTLENYGTSANEPIDVILKHIPKSHLEFFQNLESYIICGDYVFAHAGVHPEVELNEQLPDDIYWIRDEFLYHPHPFDKTVVFGHTPHVEVAFDLPYKIGIDTGLVYGNFLSCIELTAKFVAQVQSKGKEVVTSSF